VFTVVWLGSLPSLQLLVTYLVTTTVILYLLYFWPYESTFDTLSEILNEVTTLLMLYIMLSFTDWQIDEQLVYFLGYVFSAIMLLNFLAHFAALMVGTVKSIVQKGKRQWNKCKARKGIETRQMETERKL